MSSVFHEFGTFWRQGSYQEKGSPTEKWVLGSAGHQRSRAGMIDPQNRPSFPFDRATYPATLSFATQKVLLAAIFCVDSAPDKQMSTRVKYSEIIVSLFHE